MNLRLKNKKILVVGASKGIGRSIANAFANENANIVAIARSENLLQEAKTECLNLGAASFEFVVADIMEQNTEELAKRLINHYASFDVVVHNVGGSLVSRNHLAGYDDWEYALRFNALAAIDMNSILLPPMIERGYGRVIHISSISAIMLRGNPLYAAAKAYLNAYVTTVGRKLAPFGVVMCSVMPGAVSFPGSYWDKLKQDGDPKVEDFLRHHQAINRFGYPREIADVVLFMAGEQSSFMAASNIPVDGANM